jgi:hypothetical protein
MTAQVNSPAPTFELFGWRPGGPFIPPIPKNTGK